jgi:hypothetical protein
MFADQAVRDLRPTKVDEENLGPATAHYGNIPPNLVIPTGAYPDFLHAELATPTYAPFRRERCMRMANAHNVDRKSGGA